MSRSLKVFAAVPIASLLAALALAHHLLETSPRQPVLALGATHSVKLNGLLVYVTGLESGLLLGLSLGGVVGGTILFAVLLTFSHPDAVAIQGVPVGPLVRLWSRFVPSFPWRRLLRAMRDHRQVRAELSRLLVEGEALKRRAANEPEAPREEAAAWIERVTSTLTQVDAPAQHQFRYPLSGPYCAVHSDAGERVPNANEAFWNNMNAYTRALSGLIAELN
jgi:hypothetical protein